MASLAASIRGVAAMSTRGPFALRRSHTSTWVPFPVISAILGVWHGGSGWSLSRNGSDVVDVETTACLQLLRQAVDLRF